eukprot:TRINITY_DN2843_c0_g1_i1.p1 TRINITY_DN2843_c0_g1~~TRINITY_DN2843_c0_g1_i1.p1  ORF type:complete len:971 (-),score=188.09 TRINITY_DN2843_c0_g1_i1:936-3848(-)
MASSGEFSGGGDRIVVAVSNNTASKEAIKWALANKVKKGDNVLIFLHVVTRIASPMGMEMYQSEVNNTMFVHYVRTIVQPMMLQLKKLVDSRVKLELKVGRNNSKEKGVVEEAKKLRASCLVIGSSSRTMFGRGKTTTTGAFCVKARPSGISVYVIQKDKVILSHESDSTFSPPQSSGTSPSGSGRLPSGSLSPFEAKNSRSAHSSDGSGELADDDPTAVPRLMSERLVPLDGHSSELSAVRGFSSPLSANSDHGGASSPSPPVHPGTRGMPAASRLQISRAAKYGTWNGAIPPDIAAEGGLPPAHPSTGSPSHEYARQDHGSGSLRAGTEITSVSGSMSLLAPRASSGGFPHVNSSGGTSPLRPVPLPDAGDDSTQWQNKEQEAQHRAQLEYMQGLEGRLSKARAALQAFPNHESDARHSGSMRSAGGSGPMEPLNDEQAADNLAAMGHSEDDPSHMDFVSHGTGVENALLKELVMMRKKAAEADRARLEAEKRAEQLMTAADLSLKEVEAQSKKRELENAAMIERATLQATRAMASAEEARKLAETERRKSEQALTQANITRTALEQEAKKRADVEARTKKAKATSQTVKSYRQYSWEDIMTATENMKPEGKLGEGGFGTVFKGTLHHTPVAIKVLKNTDALQAASEFQQEVEVLGQIQHPHMVMLLGCCPEKYCLVYEYMANGSLEDRLACANGTPPIPWYSRMRIACEIASALLILHSRPIPIVHRDLKPANILLDKNYVAKLGDVGLARLMPELGDNQTYVRDSNPVGTFAYVDPEFQRTGEFGPKSDVYALGIVLLDLLTGRKPNVYEPLEEAVDEGSQAKLATFLDERAGKWPIDLAMEVAQIAVKCSEMRRKKRPDLETEVMPPLEKVRDIAAKAEDEHQRRPTMSFMDAPSSLFCPITQEMMVTPVLAADGHTYERLAIIQWLETNDRSPMTNVPLPSKALVPNHAVKSMITEWTERRAKA